MEFVIGRGRRVHIRSSVHEHETACGKRFDTIVNRASVDREDVCLNCMGTAEWKEQGGSRLFPFAPEPPTTTGLASSQTPPATGGASADG